MTEIAEKLIEKELKFFREKPFELCLELKDLSLNSTSAYPLVHNLKILIKNNLEFLTGLSIQKNTDITDVTQKLEKVFEEFTTIFINFFDDKSKITKKIKIKENYEKIMSYLISIFYKFEII